MTAFLAGAGEFVHRGQRVGVLRTQQPLARVEGLLMQPVGTNVVTVVLEAAGNVVHRIQDVAVVVTMPSKDAQGPHKELQPCPRRPES